MFGSIPPWSHPVLDFCLLGVFFFLITNSISLLVISLFRLFLPDSVSAGCMFIEICPFFLVYPVCWHIIVEFSWFFVSLWYWLLFLLFCFLFYLGSLFLISLAKGLSILLIFSENQLLVLLIFCVVILVSIYFLSDLYCFLPSADFGFVLLFLIPLDGRLGCLLEIILVSCGSPVLP